MKIIICKTRKEAMHYCESNEKIVPYGSVWAIIEKKDYFNFLDIATNNKRK